MGNDEHHGYPKETIEKLRLIYIAAILLWIILIIVFALYKIHALGWILLLIPLIVFLINYANLANCTIETETEMFATEFISLAVFISTILIGWSNLDRDPTV